MKRDPNEIHNVSSIDKKEEDKEDTTSKLYTERKEKSKISDEFKIRLVLDAKWNLLTLAEKSKKYFIWDATARSIIKEVTDYRNFPLNLEMRMKKRRLEQSCTKKSIEKWLCSS